MRTRTAPFLPCDSFVSALARIDTAVEVNYFLQGGVLPAVMKKMAGAEARQTGAD